VERGVKWGVTTHAACHPVQAAWRDGSREGNSAATSPPHLPIPIHSPFSTASALPCGRSAGQVPRYDAHCAFVEQGPCTPCTPARWAVEPTFSELVLFESAAVLPRFVLSIALR
jgi:hypothetical protein